MKLKVVKETNALQVQIHWPFQLEFGELEERREF